MEHLSLNQKIAQSLERLTTDSDPKVAGSNRPLAILYRGMLEVIFPQLILVLTLSPRKSFRVGL
ncbi:hypothetical protein ACOMHN_039571 [Nucella lapillus]